MDIGIKNCDHVEFKCSNNEFKTIKKICKNLYHKSGGAFPICPAMYIGNDKIFLEVS